MRRHPFDPVSLVLGAVVIVAGVAALTGTLGELLNQPAAIVPLAVGLLGLALIVSVLSRSTPSGAADGGGPEPDTGSDAGRTPEWRDPGVR